MSRLGVPALPQNYELFYETLAAPDGELAAAVAALGTNPTQKHLDDIARKHFGRQSTSIMEEAHQEISGKLDEILALLKREQSSLEKYGRLLGEASNGLDGRTDVSREFLQRIAALMSAATDTTIDQGRRTVSSMHDKSSELAEVRAKLEQYKKLAEVDSLTQLSNRRAFDNAMARLFDDKRRVLFAGLILADIDSFKPVNDRYGHPVGDRILQIVAGVFASRVRANVLAARTGGEEFALIVDGTNEEAAARLGEEIRLAVEQTPFVNVANGTNYGPITISFGLCMAAEAEGPDDLYVKADRALYASKAAGRNRLTRFSSLAEGKFTKNWLLYRRD